MNRIIEIIRFTIALLAKDTKSLIILLLMPFILIAVLGASLSGVMGGDSFDFEKAKLGIVDEDQTIASGLLVSEGFKNKEIQQLIEAKEFEDKKQAEQAYKQEKIDGILYIHDGYEYNFIYGYEDQLLLKMNPTKSIQSDVVKQMLLQYHVIGKMVVDAVNGGRSIFNFPSVETFVENASLSLETDTIGKNTRIDAFQYYTVGMGVMYALYTILTGVSFLILERTHHTYHRVAMMPFDTNIFYLGKSIAFMFISLVQLLILFISTHFVFGVGFGEHLFSLLFVMIAYTISISGLMLLLMSLIRKDTTLNVWFSVGVPVIAALGGSMVPIESFPWFIEPISKVLPNRQAIDAIFHVILGRPTEAIPSIVYLLAFAAVTATIGLWRLQRREIS